MLEGDAAMGGFDDFKTGLMM